MAQDVVEARLKRAQRVGTQPSTQEVLNIEPTPKVIQTRDNIILWHSLFGGPIVEVAGQQRVCLARAGSLGSSIISF